MVPRYRPWSGRHARNRWQFQEAYTPDRTSFLEPWREPTAPCTCMPTFKAVLQVTSWLNKRSGRLIHTRFNYHVFYINMIFIIKYKLIRFQIYILLEKQSVAIEKLNRKRVNGKEVLRSYLFLVFNIIVTSYYQIFRCIGRGHH